MVNLDDITELADETIFTLDPLPIRSFEKNYDVQLDITIEMNLSQRQIARDGYNILDYI